MRPRLRFVSLVAALLASAMLACAGVSYDESPAFAFDTRDYLGGLAAESATFAFDTRAVDGLSTSAISEIFPFDTRNAYTAELRIEGPPIVAGGSSATYRALLRYPDGAEQVVTEKAGWSFSGAEPADTTFSHSSFTPAISDTARFVSVIASYEAYGRIVSPPYQVMITPRFSVRATFEPGTFVGLLGEVRVDFSAVSSGPNGAAPESGIEWDLDGDGAFDDATGSQPWDLFPTGRTQLIGVKATDSAGAQDTDFFYLTVNRRGLFEPDAAEPVDIEGEAFKNANGNDFAFEATKAAAGLVVVTHGLFDSTESRWMKDMATHIEQRLVLAANVCLYDWEEMADPTLYRTGGGLPGSGQWGPLKADDFLLVRPYGKAHGKILAELIDNQRALGKVSKSAPVHLIGHSAGGFVVGECALQLRKKGYTMIRATMLDTPAPFIEHVPPANGPVVLERYITTGWGGKGRINYPHNWDFERHLASRRSQRYRTELLVRPSSVYSRAVVPLPSDLNGDVRGTAENDIGEDVSEDVLLHFWAHEWYLETVNGNVRFPGGFNTSPLVSAQPTAPTNQLQHGLAAANDSQEAAAQLNALAVLPDIPLSGFQTFGTVSENNGIYTITEDQNAGIYKELTIPIGARSLKFRYRLTAPADGDMLVVQWGEGAPLLVIPNLADSGGVFFDEEVALTRHAGEHGTLTIKLISRGLNGAALELADILFTQIADADGDGIANDNEAALGTDPLLQDTDGDGYTDFEEANFYHTNPRSPDTDSDGQEDATEIELGTDPMDSRSLFAVTEFSAAGSGYAIRWSSLRGKSYRMLRSPGPQFETYAVIAENILATGPESTFVETSAEAAVASRMYYRVALEYSQSDIELDPDGDGLDNAQEAMFGSNPGRYDTDRDGFGDGEEVSVLGTSPLKTDSDRDGWSDWAEFFAGTNPASGASMFAVKSLTANANGSVTVSWPGKAARVYRVDRSLSADFAEFVTLSNSVAGVEPLTLFIDTTINTAVMPQVFYRIVVE